jgi:signal transduction histidine kinase
MRAAPLVGASAGSGRWTRMVVEDTGAGISAEQLPRIFERFRRGADRDSSGFGIGLALVREIVHLHSGTIWVQSALGQGTTFTLDLPAPPNR